MPDTSKEFTLAERAILRNQRLIMLALIMLRNNITTAPHVSMDRMRTRVEQMDRHWEFIAAPSERLVPYDPDHTDIFGKD